MIPRFSTFKRSALAAMALTAFAAPAFAQMGPPPPGGMMMVMTKHMGPPSPEMEKAMAEHKAQMARDMHTILRLRADQESAWQAFEGAMTPPPPPASMPEMPPAAGGALQHLDMMDKHMTAMTAQHAKMEAAIRTFYAALSPDQQQVFDALVRLLGLPGPHGPGGEGGHHGMMMGPPPHP